MTGKKRFIEYSGLYQRESNEMDHNSCAVCILKSFQIYPSASNHQISQRNDIPFNLMFFVRACQ
jgi:hypothetical protein